MSVFNSLGSNYSWNFAWRNLFSAGSPKLTAEFIQTLSSHYGGKAVLTYKGREALELAMRSSGLPAGSSVAINGFTCYVVFQAIEKAGYKPVFVDLAEGELNFDLKGLKAKHKILDNLKAIVIQNTLGQTVDIAEVEAYCHEHKLLIIEDLAHSLGAVYPDGREAGTVGDLVMLSFSQDKPLDVVAGGAYVDRREEKSEASAILTPMDLSQRLKNRIYPLFTEIIRSTYPSGLGRYIHRALKSLNWLATPMSDGLEGLHPMSAESAEMALGRWKDRETELSHRQQIAKIYDQTLPSELIIKPKGGQAGYLRYSLWLEDRQSLVQFLRKYQIYIGDTWYDAPIAPSRYLAKTNYQKGECPNGEALSEHIVNLPTHSGISPEIAGNICARIMQWQALAPKS
jgi:dTDP-4-amino-4,6-dideoxygalactose transaminase